MSAAFRRLKRQLAAAAGATKPRVPEAGRLAWGWFVALGNARTYHAAGPNPIGLADIEAFARLHRLPIEPRHVELIQAMDDAWIEKTLARTGKPSALTFKNAPPITAEIFDRLFAS